MAVKGKASCRVFELKQRVVLGLNKLADRDTYLIGVEDLEKIVECLTPDGISPFLSCILDTDSQQKSAVRKECVRLMGTLATFHESLVSPHLGKMVASIVKRLKDSDSVVRDACIETVGVLASKLSSIRNETDGVFTLLVRPLFEALGEQNKQVQTGSALCLSRVIDNIHDPPPLVLQKMLARTVKLLKNTHFMAKPAVVELNRSIILAGGAPTHNSLNAALTSIQEALKNSDWTARKAACAALGEIASCGVACLSSFRSSCIRCLESCRFDKVKPVRDVALQALQLWRNLPGPDTPEPSEVGSSIKESYYRDEYGDITSACDSTLKDTTPMKSGGELAKKKVPLSFRKADRTCTEKSQQSGVTDWQIEIAIPKSHNISVNQNDESEGSSVTKRCDRTTADVRNFKNIEYDYVAVDDKQEYSSVSKSYTETIKSKVLTPQSDAFDEASLVKSTGSSQRYAADEVSIEEQRYHAKKNDRRSLESTVTDSDVQAMPCCSQTEKDMVLIKEKLLEIENKQSNLMDMLKAFTTTVMNSMSLVQSKVSNLEVVVDEMAREIVRGGRYSDVSSTKILKKGPTTASPRLSTCTPRTSVDSNRQPQLLPTKHAGLWEDNSLTKSRSSSFGKQNLEMWADASPKYNNTSFRKGNATSFFPDTRGDQIRKKENVFESVPHTKSRLNKLETKNSQLTVLNNYFSKGDLDSAYTEALCSRNEILLFELLDQTGPVLESLSQKTASNLLSTLALYLSEQRFVKSIIPWFQQLVDLSDINGPTYMVLVLSTKAKRDILSAVWEAAKLDVSTPAERKYFMELGKTLREIWS